LEAFFKMNDGNHLRASWAWHDARVEVATCERLQDRLAVNAAITASPRCELPIRNIKSKAVETSTTTPRDKSRSATEHLLPISELREAGGATATA
jgi:hypothetical protein